MLIYYYFTKFSDTLFNLSKEKKPTSKCNNNDKAGNICAVMEHTIKILHDEQKRNSIVKKKLNVKKGADFHLCQRVYETLKKLPEEKKKQLKSTIIHKLLNV